MPGSNDTTVSVKALVDGLSSFLGDLDKAGGGVDDFGNKAEHVSSSMDSATTSSGGLGNSLKSVGQTAAGFALGSGILQAPSYLLDGAKAAAEDEAATARFNQAIQNLGGDMEHNTQQFNAAIGAGQDLAFSDDEVRNALASLSVATGDGDEAMRRLSLAQDLARGTGMPLEQAAKMLGKVTDENVNVFKKLGLEMDSNATEADVLAAVQGAYAGQAKAFADSTAGQFAQSQIAMGELQETIGYALLPVMTALGELLTSVLIPGITAVVTAISTALAPVMEQIVGLVGTLGEHMDIVGPALAALGVAVGVAGAVILATLVPAFIAWAAAALAAAAATIAAALPFVALVAAVALVTFGIIELVQHWDDITEKFPILQDIVDAVVVSFHAFVGYITGSVIPALTQIGQTAVEIGQTIFDAFQSVIDFVIDNWQTIGPILAVPFNLAKDLITIAWQTIQGVIQGALQVIQGIIDVFIGVFTGDWSQAWDGIKEILGGVWTAIQALLTGYVSAILAYFGSVWSLLEALIGDPIDAAKATLQAIWTGIQAIFTTTVSAITGIINGTWHALTDLITSAIETAKNTLQGIWDGIKAIFNDTVTAITAIITGTWNALTALIKDPIGTAKDGLQAIWDTIKGIFNDTVSIITGIITGSWSLLTEMIKSPIIQAKDDLRVIWDEIKDIFSNAWTWVSGWIATFWNTLTNLIKQPAQEAIDGVKTIFTDGMALAVGALQTGLTNILTEVGSWAGAIAGAMAGVGTWLYQAGKDLVQGFLNGLADAATGIPGAIAGAFGGVGGMVAGHLGLGSPSRIAYSHAEMFIQGFINGLDSMTGPLSNALLHFWMNVGPWTPPNPDDLAGFGHGGTGDYGGPWNPWDTAQPRRDRTGDSRAELERLYDYIFGDTMGNQSPLYDQFRRIHDLQNSGNITVEEAIRQITELLAQMPSQGGGNTGPIDPTADGLDAAEQLLENLMGNLNGMGFSNALIQQIATAYSRYRSGQLTAQDVLRMFQPGGGGAGNFGSNITAGMMAGAGSMLTLPTAPGAMGGTEFNFDFSGAQFLGTPDENSKAFRQAVEGALSDHMRGGLIHGLRSAG